MFSVKEKELIDYFILQFAKKEEFQIIPVPDFPISTYYFRLVKGNKHIGIGYINKYKRIEIFSDDKLFKDILVIRNKEDINETLRWLSFNNKPIKKVIRSNKKMVRSKTKKWNKDSFNNVLRYKKWLG